MLIICFKAEILASLNEVMARKRLEVRMADGLMIASRGWLFEV